MTRYITLILIIFLVVACNNDVPSGVIKQPEMQSVFWDLINADNLAKEIVKKDSTKKLSQENIKLINQVLAIHKLSKNDLDKSLAYYQKHPDLMANIFDSIQVQQARKNIHPWDQPLKKTVTSIHEEK